MLERGLPGALPRASVAQVGRVPRLRRSWSACWSGRLLGAIGAPRAAPLGVPDRAVHQDRAGAAGRLDRPRGHRAGRGPAIVQSLLLISLRVPRDLVACRDASAWMTSCGPCWRRRVSICGVSAAIAAAGAVHAKKEQLAYVASLVVLFAIPMHLHPALARHAARPVAARRRRLDRRQHRHDRRRRRGRAPSSVTTR